MLEQLKVVSPEEFPLALASALEKAPRSRKGAIKLSNQLASEIVGKLRQVNAPLPLIPNMETDEGESPEQPLQQLAASLLPDSLDTTRRTVDVLFYSGEPVMRFDWMKGEPYKLQFSLKPDDVRLGRLNAGAPFLNSHDAFDLSSVIGVVEKAWIDKVGKARVRFSDRADVEPIWRDIQNGIIRKVSMGALIHKTKDITPKPKNETDRPMRHVLATDWEPMEISAVAVPADPKAGFLSFQMPELSSISPLERGAVYAVRATMKLSDTRKQEILEQLRDAGKRLRVEFLFLDEDICLEGARHGARKTITLNIDSIETCAAEEVIRKVLKKYIDTLTVETEAAEQAIKQVLKQAGDLADAGNQRPAERVPAIGHRRRRLKLLGISGGK